VSEGESDISNLLLLHAQNVQNAIEEVEIWVAFLQQNTTNQGFGVFRMFLFLVRFK